MIVIVRICKKEIAFGKNKRTTHINAGQMSFFWVFDS